MGKFADLHVHTNLSDGTFTPHEVVEKAKEAGLCCIAITDHDSVDAIEPAFESARKIGLEIIPGVEMTAQEKGFEVHILGFFPDIKDSKFLNKLKTIRQARIDRIYKMVEKLKKYNVTVDAEKVFRSGGLGSVGRLHLAAVLKEEGFVSTRDEAFRRFIGDQGPCYVKHFEISVKDAISELQRVGAVVVFAHPHLTGGENMILKLIKYGLDGIEAYHSEQPKSVSELYLELAREHKLIVTGGSDCHGLNKDEVLLGKVKVPYEIVERLKICAAKKRNT